MGTKLEDIPTTPFKRHVVYELTPGPFGCRMKEIEIAKEFAHMWENI
jgi:hypothetical protein